MSFKTKIGDITKQNVDAVINSLGINGYNYGRICRNIIKKAKSVELKNYIDNLTNNKEGDFYITEGYEIKAKNIIHLVTPFKKHDDKDCSKLKNAVIKVIDKAIELKYKSIAIPFLGVGANGYSKKEVNKVLTSICADIDDKEIETGKKIIDITILVYFSENNDFDDMLSVTEIVDCCKMPSRLIRKNENIDLPREKMNYSLEQRYESTEDSDMEYNEIYEISKKMGSLKKEDFFHAHYENYYAPYDFIVDYAIQNNFNEVKKYRGIIDHNRLGQIREQKTLKKKTMFLLGYLLGFSETVMIEFLISCGLSYQPNNPLDDFFRSYFSGELGVEFKNIFDLQSYYYDNVEPVYLTI